MNWLPSRKYKGTVTARKIRLIAITSFQCLRHQRRTGKYMACVIRAAGLRDSRLSLPRTNNGMSAGTKVIESNDEKTRLESLSKPVAETFFLPGLPAKIPAETRPQ